MARNVKKPKAEGTKLAHHLRLLAEVGTTSDYDGQALTRAADDLDKTAKVLGVSGVRVTTLGAYLKAKALYERVSGKPYRDA